MRNLLVLTLSLLLAACGREPPAVEATPAVESGNASTAATTNAATPVAATIPPGDPVEGARVARRVGCDGCHDEGGRGQELWGEPGKYQVRSPNLTVKRDLYDDAGIEALLRKGRTHDGHRPLGMPVHMFQHLSDREVRDITAWLRALPAVDHPGLAESHLTPKTLKSLLDGTHPYATDDKPDIGNVPPGKPPVDPLALGKYLAFSSCSECHGKDLNGFVGGDAPSLVVAKAYTLEHFRRLMKTGEVAAGGKSKTGFMSEIAAYRFSGLTDSEVSALKLYLDSR